jgi:3-dehydroquinate synthase
VAIDDRNIVFTGFMGTGKSQVAREVAERVGRPFVDMDAVLEERLGDTVAGIFHTLGEAAFRREEAALCGELATRRGQVIATGGGALIPAENRRRLTRTSQIICLQCDTEELLRRLSGDGSRPLLEGRRQRERVETLLKERMVAYESFSLKIDTTDLTVQEVADKAMKMLEGVKVLPVDSPTGSYQIWMGGGALDRLGDAMESAGLGPRTAVVTNSTLAPLYGHRAADALERQGFDPCLLEVPDGERFKTLDTVRGLYEDFLDQRLDRSSVVVALGGGVMGDMAGFVAATYMRGLPLVHVPTTLLSVIDSSIGGKTAVDLPRGKNLVGAFYPPKRVVTDPSLLDTLPKEEFRSGLGEVVKAAVIGSEALFRRLEGEGLDSLPWILREAIGVKVALVEEDPYERGRRAELNLGHTFGHALETLSNYSLRHGDAVSIGQRVAARTAVGLGLCDPETEARIVALLEKLELPTSFDGYDPEDVWEAMSADKKKRGKRLRFVLPVRIGEVTVTEDVTRETALRALEETRRKESSR